MWNGRNVHQTFELQGKNIQIPGNNYASAVEIDNPSIKRKADIKNRTEIKGNKEANIANFTEGSQTTNIFFQLKEIQ